MTANMSSRWMSFRNGIKKIRLRNHCGYAACFLVIVYQRRPPVCCYFFADDRQTYHSSFQSTLNICIPEYRSCFPRPSSYVTSLFRTFSIAIFADNNENFLHYYSHSHDEMKPTEIPKLYISASYAYHTKEYFINDGIPAELFYIMGSKSVYSQLPRSMNTGSSATPSVPVRIA